MHGSAFTFLWALSFLFLVSRSNGIYQHDDAAEGPVEPLRLLTFRWKSTDPIFLPPSAEYDGIMEPSIVHYSGRWHLFCTLQGERRRRTIEYLSFSNWEDPSDRTRHILAFSQDEVRAPQILYFSPWRSWILLYELAEKSGQVIPAFSLSSELDSPDSWTPPRRIDLPKPAETDRWRDFWLIRHQRNVFLFWTAGSSGELWRSETSIDSFPGGWTRPALALKGNFFKGAHVYRIRGQSLFLAVLEAHRQWRRYYKAYWSDDLRGKWHPLAITRTHAFASRANVISTGPDWTDSFSHGEIIRHGFDERLEIHLENLRFVFQGVAYRDRDGKRPRQVPWKIGLLIGASER